LRRLDDRLVASSDAGYRSGGLPLRIALIAATTRVDGGVGVHVKRSRHVLRAAGHEVLVAAADTEREADTLEWTVAEQRSGAAGAARLADRLTECAIDVAHVHGIEDPALVSALSPICACVLSAHNWSGCAPQTRYFGAGRECRRSHGPGCVANMMFRNCNHRIDPRPIFREYGKAQQRLIALGAAHVAVAHSSAVEAHLRMNGITRTSLVPLPVTVPTQVVPMPCTPRVAYVGRLTSVKGVDVLLRAARWFDTPIDVCGDGYARPRLERLAQRLGIAHRTSFHGWCSEAGVASVMDAAQLVVVPSRYPEPFGMVGPEALARGRAVVASSTGGVCDWLDDGTNGIAVPPGDDEALGHAIASLLGDRVRLEAMARAGRASVQQRFTDAAHVAALISAYERACETFDEWVPPAPVP
jgi:glycosyltransferase involved in cell wall biosynthesis